MITRTLPMSEWHRLPIESGIPTMQAYVTPEDMEVTVVEHESVIVGCWAVLRIVHVEGLWVHPLYRKHAGVARRLFTSTWRTVQAWARSWVMTAAITDDVKGLLRDHMGAVAVPGEMFVVPVQRSAETCR